ncbi:hypothetical protein J7E50_02700 [Pedobacter sp. ISL-68]|uniref:hypothetical protein n=1 Tax=unclassified Pedobacter TaxID=2628915 RepID=UPI001BE500D2|nr:MULTISPECIES: hypothetical protein [unclassified Pedobacter]MBT2560129.1 hypothetical protein [Pedobacter sp. ISL-64]MBT2589108.1 hypothetical protein [Pedobacter sp. ISL-68]
MFKKIHSNRDPADTLYREIKKEFSIYFDKAGASLTSFLTRYPRAVFTVMTLLMTVSLVLSFTVLRSPVPRQSAVRQAEKQEKPSSGGLSTVTGGLNQILQTTSDLRETLELKKEVEALMQKKQLTPADSLALEMALDRFGRLGNHLSK